jgi:hypothetical protein
MNAVSVVLGLRRGAAGYSNHGLIRGDEAVSGLTRGWSVNGRSGG